jgi:hypothetical protein
MICATSPLDLMRKPMTSFSVRSFLLAKLPDFPLKISSMFCFLRKPSNLFW